MNRSNLPVELCEYIMETVADAPVQQAFTEGEEQRTLCACALVCRAWHTRAQFLLWKVPYLRTVASLSAFSTLVTTSSDWSRSLVMGIALHPPRDDNPPGFARAVHTLFMHTFPSLRFLSCSHVKFHLGPRMFRMRLPFFRNLPTLRLRFCEFESARALFDVVWAFPNLSSLEIVSCFLVTPPTAASSARLSEICRHLRGCAKLTDLHLFDPTFLDPAAPVIGSVFGSNLKSLILPITHCNDLVAFLNGSFPALHTITITCLDDFPTREDREGQPWLHAMAASLAAPHQLKKVRFVRKHCVDDNSCCQVLVGTGEDGVSTRPPLHELLSGIEELKVSFLECTKPESCVAYVRFVLPRFGAVLRFDTFDADARRWHDYTGTGP